MVKRDSYLGERIVWSTHPTVIETPRSLKAVAAVCFLTSAVSTAFAVVVALALGISPVRSLVFASWAASLGIACWQLPKVWLSKVQYLVTERHVVMQRGPFRRTIERSAISFARIFWNDSESGVGDIDLVRAVPTGALRRRLLLQIRGVAAPDQVWAIIRGVERSVGAHKGDRPLTQRLDDGERVVWSARPKSTRRWQLPTGRREWSVLALSLIMFLTFANMVARAVPNFRILGVAGIAESPGAALSLVFAMGLVMLLVLGLGTYFLYDAVIAPARKLERTSYLITNRRVLIQRGREELHLDRTRIVDVIRTPAENGLSNVFLVLDGPRARALAISGAFGEGERGPQLRPVLRAVEDSEGISQILLDADEPRQAA